MSSTVKFIIDLILDKFPNLRFAWHNTVRHAGSTSITVSLADIPPSSICIITRKRIENTSNDSRHTIVHMKNINLSNPDSLESILACVEESFVDIQQILKQE